MRSTVNVLLSALILALPSLASAAPETKVTWTSSVVPSDARAGESAQIILTAAIKPGWHIYSLSPNEIGVATNIDVKPSPLLKPQGKVVQPPPHKVHDAAINKDYEAFEDGVAFGAPVQIAKNARGTVKAVVAARSQACNASVCDFPISAPVEVTIRVAPGPTRANRMAAVLTVPQQPQKHDKAVGGGQSGGAGSVNGRPGSPGGAGGVAKEIQEAKGRGVLAFVWLSLAAGFAALFTPCVFPMIPITVSFFAKRRAGSANPIAGPLAYCLGIIGAFTGLGLLFSVVFGATKIQSFAANPFVNLFLAALFIVLAANLFGAFEIGMPQSLVNSAHAGTRREGLVGPLLMGLTFTLTSFTCTVPFVGTLLVTATQGSLLYPLVGMLSFSAAFALPFFLLALFPQYLARLPKSGSWLVSVKAFMGFVELAAALKFLSNADLVWQSGLLTRPVFLAVWAAIACLASLYLLGWVKLPHDGEGKVGILRRGLGVVAAVAAVYCLAAMNGVSLGTLEAFPPPDRYPGSSTYASGTQWHTSFVEAASLAKAQNKSVFINFTGATCVNCREMEKNVLPAPEVVRELARYVPVELYTDRPTAADMANQQFLLKLANTAANPVYAVVTAEGRVVRILEGRHNVEEFAQFLHDAGASSPMVASR